MIEPVVLSSYDFFHQIVGITISKIEGKTFIERNHVDFISEDLSGIKLGRTNANNTLSFYLTNLKYLFV